MFFISIFKSPDKQQKRLISNSTQSQNKKLERAGLVNDGEQILRASAAHFDRDFRSPFALVVPQKLQNQVVRMKSGASDKICFLPEESASYRGRKEKKEWGERKNGSQSRQLRSCCIMSGYHSNLTKVVVFMVQF